MTSFTEKEIAYCAFYVIKKHKKINTKNLMLALRHKMKPIRNDALLLKGRPDDLFSQKVRNLKSHDTLAKLQLARFKEKYFLYLEDNKITEFESENPLIVKKFKKLFIA